MLFYVMVGRPYYLTALHKVLIVVGVVLVVALIVLRIVTARRHGGRGGRPPR